MCRNTNFLQAPNKRGILPYTNNHHGSKKDNGMSRAVFPCNKCGLTIYSMQQVWTGYMENTMNAFESTSWQQSVSPFLLGIYHLTLFFIK